MPMNRFEWTSVQTVAEATAAAATTVADAMLAPPGGATPGQAAVLKAGGIDLLDLMKERLLAPRRVINVRTIPELDRIAEEADGGVRIGALGTLQQVAENLLVVRRYAALADALAGSASPQIRHVATLGGNILQRPRCWYFRSEAHRCLRKGGGRCFAIHGENQYHAIFANEVCAVVHPSTAATALVALGAAIEIANAQGDVRRTLLDDFFVAPEIDVQRENDLKPGEVVTAIILPALAAGTTSAHMREADKLAFDWPIADVAVVLERDADRRCRRAAIVLGAAAPVPYRARTAEDLLAGKIIDAAVARAAGQAALEGATPLSKNHHKPKIFAALVRRALLRAAGEA
jgi:xanthine dehydrogenase YagS FAD-binding subunit